MDYRRLQPHLFGLGIHRASLFAVLHDEVVRVGVPIATGIEAVRVEAHARQRAVVVDGLGRHHGPFDLVVDASGMRSPLRSVLSGRIRDRPFKYGAIWGAIPITDAWPHRATLMQRYDGAPVMIGVLPIGRLPTDPTDRCAFFWSVRVDQREAWLAAGLDAWKAHVASLWPAVRPILDGVRTASDLSFVSYSDVVVARPHCADLSLAVIGDGAHGTSPQLGQGANLPLSMRLRSPRRSEASRRSRRHFAATTISEGVMSPSTSSRAAG